MSSLKTPPFRSAQGSKRRSPFGSGYSDFTDLGIAMYDLMVWQSVVRNIPVLTPPPERTLIGNALNDRRDTTSMMLLI